MAQQNPLTSLTADVLQLQSELKVLRKTVYLLKVLVCAQLTQNQPELEALLENWSQAERTFDPQKPVLDVFLRVLRRGTEPAES